MIAMNVKVANNSKFLFQIVHFLNKVTNNKVPSGEEIIFSTTHLELHRQLYVEQLTI